MTPDPHDLLNPQVIQDPYSFYDAVREEAPVWEVGKNKVFIVTSFANLSDATRRIGNFSSVLTALLYKDTEGLPATLPVDLGDPTLATADPPVHTVHKKLIFPRFVGKRMSLIEDELARFTRQCLDNSKRLNEFDFMNEIGSAVPIHAISQLIGFRDCNEQMLLDTAYTSIGLTAGVKTLEELAASQLRIDEISTWFASQLEERDGHGSEDLLDAIKQAVDAGQLTQREGIITMITLLSAGGESTASLLGNAVRILAERPELQEALRGNMELLPAFIEEALRLESPFRHHLRSVPHDTELGGVPIPAGSTVLLMWGAANRDPDKYPNPNELSLDRRQHHVTFGHGIHLCVGATLARMEARVVLTELLKRDRFPTLSKHQAPEWEYSLQVRRHRILPMTWHSPRPL